MYTRWSFHKYLQDGGKGGKSLKLRANRSLVVAGGNLDSHISCKSEK